MPPSRHYTYSAPPELDASILPRRYTCSEPPALHTSIPPRLHAGSEPLKLHTSIPLCLHVPRSAARLQSPVPPSCYTYSAPPDLHSSISLRLQRASRLPFLSTSTSICAPAARSRNSALSFLSSYNLGAMAERPCNIKIHPGQWEIPKGEDLKDMSEP